jgi:hypothetical protein
MKNAVFWDVAPCRFRLSFSALRTVVSLLLTVYTFLLSRYFFYPEDGGDTFVRNAVYNTPPRGHIPEDGILLIMILTCNKYIV